MSFPHLVHSSSSAPSKESGSDDDNNDPTANYFTSILSWDPVAESWQPAGDLDVARARHAAVAVPTALVEC